MLLPKFNRPRDTQFVIPGDPESSMYRFIIVAAKRARQLQAGSRPALPTQLAQKPTVAAMEEVRRGLVSYETYEKRRY